MSRISVLSTRRLVTGAVFLSAVVAAVGTATAETPQTSTIKPGSAEERLRASNGRETDLQIARGRPSDREVAARVRDERSAWSYQLWAAYARSMRGK